MSLANFERLNSEYASISGTALCYVAAIDCVSHNDIPLAVYLAYRDLIAEEDERGASLDLKQRGEKVVLDQVGVETPDAVKKFGVTHPGEMRTYLLEAKKKGERVLALSTINHIVGVVPTENGKWRFVGQGVPTTAELDEYEVYDHVFPISWIRSRLAYNLEVLPPEE